MANYTLFNNVLVEASSLNLQPNEQIIALSSAEITNANSPENSVRVVIDYDGLTPAFGTARIGAILEGKDDAGIWHPIHYQFSALSNANFQATERVMILQPNMDTFNLGIDDVVYPVNKEVSRISRQQGRLPDTAWRLCILLLDSDPAGPSGFQSVTVSATAETYNV